MNLMIMADGVMKGIGGSERFLVDLLNGLPKDRFNITLTCIDEGQPAENLKDLVRETGVRFIVCPYKKSRKLDATSILRLRKLIVKLQIDVIHANSGYAAIAGSLARIGLNTRLVYVMHTEMLFSMRTRLFFCLLRPLITAQIAVSSVVAKNMRKKKFLIPFKKADRVIYNGIDLDNFQPLDSKLAKRKLGLEGMIIGSVGRLVTMKGYSYLIRAFAKLKDEFPALNLVLVGEGPEKSELKMLAKMLNVSERIFFLGTRTDIPEVLSAFDVFILPSLTEALSISVLEAMAVCKPVVASDVGGLGEIVSDWENGFLVPPGDVDALAQAIATIIKNVDISKRMGMNGRLIVQQGFSVDRMISDYINLYSDVAIHQ
jgi:glycosyltransferase involved in cell wall biosynthesis